MATIIHPTHLIVHALIPSRSLTFTQTSQFQTTTQFISRTHSVGSHSFGVIHLCGAFWQAPLIGTDSQGGTLVHESSHFVQNAGTTDLVYGQPNCKTTALTDPGGAIDNADSHEYFAENNPAET